MIVCNNPSLHHMFHLCFFPVKDGYCPALSPKHGSVKQREDTRLLETAVLTCDAGFIPASGNSFTCEVLSATAGRWSGQAECVRK